jgi:hypothetical protein
MNEECKQEEQLSQEHHYETERWQIVEVEWQCEACGKAGCKKEGVNP